MSRLRGRCPDCGGPLWRPDHGYEVVVLGGCRLCSLEGETWGKTSDFWVREQEDDEGIGGMIFDVGAFEADRANRYRAAATADRSGSPEPPGVVTSEWLPRVWVPSGHGCRTPPFALEQNEDGVVVWSRWFRRANSADYPAHAGPLADLLRREARRDGFVEEIDRRDFG